MCSLDAATTECPDRTSRGRVVLFVRTTVYHHGAQVSLRERVPVPFKTVPAEAVQHGPGFGVKRRLQEKR